MSIYLGLPENSFCHPADLVATTQVGPNVLRCVMSETKEIPLTQGQFAIVDTEDYEWLNQWKWYAHKGRDTFYAIRNALKPNGKRKQLLMHRLILATPIDMQTDHANGNGIDNRRSNLRICTRQQNSRNRKLNKDNTSGHKGVGWDARTNTWQARIAINGKLVHLGRYGSISEAVAVRQAKEKEVFGEFMRPEGIVG